MNEELKIIIRAITDDAKKNIAAVNKELDGLQKTATSSGNRVDKALNGMRKAATAAVGVVAALAGSMVALSRSSLEFQKTQSRLNAGFASMGLSAQQAANTYKQLFGFLGNADQSVETANLLAQLTQEESNLAEWTNILMGVYAKFPDSLPVESLAEAVNHTAQLGEVQGVLADALEWVGVNVDSFNAALANTTTLEEREALIRSTLNALYGGAATAYAQANSTLIAYNQSQVAVNQALAEATACVIPLMTAVNQLAAAAVSILKPAFETISAVLIVFIQWILAAIQAVASFFGAFSGGGARSVTSSMGSITTSSNKAAKSIGGVGSALGGAAKAAKELKRQTMGFDELNVMASQTAASGGGGGGGGVSVPDLSIPSTSFGNLNLPGLDDFEKKVASIKEKLEPILMLVGLIGSAFAGWKVGTFIKSLGGIAGLAPILKTIGSYLLMISGVLVAVIGYSHAWVNGINWGNLAATFVGLAAAIGGIYLVFGPLAATLTTLVSGFALLVLGMQDFINQGATVQNVITMIAGAALAAIAMILMGFSPVVAILTGVVPLIGSVTAALLLEQPAILSVEEAQNRLNAAKEAAYNAEMNYVSAVDAAEAAMNRLTAAEDAAGMTGAELNAMVEQGIIDYAEMDATQRELYKAYLDNEQKQADLKASTEELTAAKKEETLASFENQLALAKESGNYDDYKKSVVDAYEEGMLSADEARDLIEKSMSEMSDASQQTFMEDLPNDIKQGMDPSRYESTGTKLKKKFSEIWKSIKDVFKDVKSFFGDIGTKIGSALSDAAASAVRKVLNWAVSKINSFISSINWAIGIINKIPGVSIGYVSQIPVPALATGGITTGATMALIGERGKEAVLPLENNTGWMDTLADRINGRNGTPTKIVLQLDGKELGWANINSINNITKQTGELQLVLA